MKRWWAGLPALGLLLCSLAIHAEDVLISSGEYPPWTGEKLQDGGYVNRIVREAFRREGLTVQFRYTPWPRAIAELRAGEVQASSYWAHDPVRDKDFLLSDSLIEDKWLLFHRRDTQIPPWHHLADLSRFRFGVTRSYTYTRELWDLIGQGVIKASVAPDDRSTIDNLLHGFVDIAPMEPLTEEAVLASPAFPPGARNQIVAEAQPFRVLPGYLLVRNTPEGARLIQLINAGLSSMKADGTLDRYRASIPSIQP